MVKISIVAGKKQLPYQSILNNGSILFKLCRMIYIDIQSRQQKFGQFAFTFKVPNRTIKSPCRGPYKHGQNGQNIDRDRCYLNEPTNQPHEENHTPLALQTDS